MKKGINRRRAGGRGGKREGGKIGEEIHAGNRRSNGQVYIKDHSEMYETVKDPSLGRNS